MQSTPSRARHSNNICAPLINVDDISLFLKNFSINEKGHRPGVVYPADGLGNLRFRLASGGAGYDDHNNNDYRDRNGTGENETTEPTCESGKHGKRLNPS